MGGRCFSGKGLGLGLGREEYGYRVVILDLTKLEVSGHFTRFGRDRSRESLKIV